MTLFPELVRSVLDESIIGRAQKAGYISVNTYNIRDYSEDKHRRVDDTPYGGGRGMLMTAPPIYRCYQAVLADTGGGAVADTEIGEGDGGTGYETKMLEKHRRRVLYMSPKGRVLTQGVAAELAGYDRLIILCGHYEGVDQRVIDEIVDEEISIGDYVLTGGELPACVLVDCVARLREGVLPDPICHTEESISSGLLEYPQYTRPYEFRGVSVPDVLISGHHENIDKWRRQAARELTERLRPDLLSDK